LLMMKMNGLKTIYYYISHYLTFYFLYSISSVIFLLCGFLTNLTFFNSTETSVLILIFFLWGHGMFFCNGKLKYAFPFSSLIFSTALRNRKLFLFCWYCAV
jgi:hypothetical protein